MADFLASFGIVPEPAAGPSNARGCASVEELQTQLRDLISDKVTATRASHVSTALQLRATAPIELNLAESENEALAGLGNLDPLLGGLRSTPAGAESVRVVNASEALRNQPASDPALQKAVAKHLVAAIGEADASTWTIREVSRQGQGWTFTYHCKDSVQHWTRQNAKAPEKHVIGEWYQKDPDPVLDNRPAFDCRGTLTIAFPRNGRSISVKYEHTPLHMTVAQLRDKFKPPPRPLPPQKTAEAKSAKDPNAPKTPKTPKTPAVPKAPKAPKTPKTGPDGKPKEKKKRVSTAGEGSEPRKRKKKNDGNPQSSNNESTSLFVDSDHPAYDSTPAATSNAGSASTGPSNAQAAAASASAVFPNVSASEAARRKDVAVKLLTEAGVDPASLSVDQFSIFANQSPELQKDSLAMLVKYGAERLRIVQPTTGGSGQQPTPAPSQASANGAVTTKELVPQHRSPLPGTPSATQKSAANGAANTPKSGKLGKSRLVCYQCKERRVKCSKERPTCEDCAKESRSCEYPPQPVRSSRKKSEAIVVDSDGGEDDDDDAGAQDTQQEPAEESGNTSNWQMPVATMLGPTVEPPIHNPQPEAPGYYQSATGVPLQHDDSHQQTDMSAASGLALLQNNTYGSDHSLSNPVQPLHGSHGVDPSSISSRRGLRTSEHAGKVPASVVAAAPGASPSYSYQAPTTQSDARVGHHRSASAAQRERLAHSASPRVVAAVATATQGRTSPAQRADQARTKSAQGQRGQSVTPANQGPGNGRAQVAGGGNAANNLNPLRDSSGRATTRYSAQNPGGMGSDGSADRIPYQPYSHGHAHQQQARSNAAASLPTTGPSAAPTTYTSASGGSQWGTNTSEGTDGGPYGVSNQYSHAANSQQGTANNASLRRLSHHQQQQQQQQSGTQRDYQSFSSQPQHTSQQTGGQQQQNSWYGVNNASNVDSYNSFGQYWQG